MTVAKTRAFDDLQALHWAVLMSTSTAKEEQTQGRDPSSVHRCVANLRPTLQVEALDAQVDIFHRKIWCVFHSVLCHALGVVALGLF